MSLNRITLGTAVRVRHQPDRDRGYIKMARGARQVGDTLTGIVIAEHDSHGLCYEVRFASGTVITYDREELEETSDVFAGAQYTGSDPTLRTAARISQEDRQAAATKKGT